MSETEPLVDSRQTKIGIIETLLNVTKTFSFSASFLVSHILDSVHDLKNSFKISNAMVDFVFDVSLSFVYHLKPMINFISLHLAFHNQNFNFKFWEVLKKARRCAWSTCKLVKCCKIFRLVDT